MKHSHVVERNQDIVHQNKRRRRRKTGRGRMRVGTRVGEGVGRKVYRVGVMNLAVPTKKVKQ